MRTLLVPVTMTVMLVATACSGSKPTAGQGGSAPSSASQTAKATDQIDASISGHIATSWKSVYPNGSVIEQSQSMDWTVTLQGSQDDVTSGKALPQISELSGDVNWSGSGGRPCHGSLSKKEPLTASDLNGLLTVEPPGDQNVAENAGSGIGPQNNADSKDYLLEATVPSKALVSSDTDPGDAQCNTIIAQGELIAGPPSSAPEFKVWRQGMAPYAMFDGDGNSTSDPTIQMSWSGSIPGGDSAVGVTDTGSVQLSETFSFGGCVVRLNGSAGALPQFGTGSQSGIQLAAARMPADNGASGCPSIIWTNDPDHPGKDVDVTDDSATVMVGQRVHLTAEPNGKVVTQGVQWTIPSPAAQFYSPTAFSASVQMAPSTSSESPIQFFWVSAGNGSDAPGAARSSQKTVTLTVNNGKKVHVDFTVKSPAWSMGPADTCQPGLDTKLAHNGVPLPAFGLGWNDNCQSKDSPIPGIKFDAGITGDPAYLGVTQLIVDQMLHNGGECPGPGGGGTAYAADNHAFYVEDKGTRVPTLNDSPVFSLKSKSGTYTWTFLARDYLMYRPDIADSAYVPLGRLDWRWTATVEKGGLGFGGWSLKSQQMKANSAISWFEEPTWSSVRTNANAFDC